MRSTRIRLRLLTFNIAHGRGLSPIQGLLTQRKIRANLLKISRLLTTVEADVVAFQEVDRYSRWAGNFDQLEFLREHTRMAHAVFGINTQREGLLNLCYGNGLLSEYPIVRTENVVFGKKQIGEKGFLFVELDVAGHRVPIINLHLHYRSRVQRFKQLDRLTEWLAREHRLHGAHWSMLPIVCGDFNAPRIKSDVTASLHSHLQGLADYRLLPEATDHTFPSAWPQFTYDFVFVPPECRRAHSVVVKSFLSDHRPVLVEFEL